MKIQPVEIPTKGTAVSLDVTVLSFKLNSESGSSYYKLSSESGQTLLEGNLNIPSSVFLNWGTDDSIVLDYVLSELKLVAMPDEEPLAE